jgi:CIC family chloride channel protein
MRGEKIMTESADGRARFLRHLLRRLLLLPLLRLRVWLTERVPENIWESNYLWAAAVGLFGAFSSVAFREALSHLQLGLLRYNGPLEGAATALPWWGRLLMPAVGGLVAGLILFFGQRWSRAKRSLDFMEVIVLGNGIMRVRDTLVKSVSSLVTISSGGSIGREGSMVQLSSMLASLFGRQAKISPARLRLLVACGAAAGIACAYNAPLTGAFFVAEIVLGSIAMESFLPLAVASVVATVVSRQFLGSAPVYHMPNFGDVPNWQLIAHILLGIVAGMTAPLFLLSLHSGERLFQRLSVPIFLKLALGGLIVGAISMWTPAVWGNGYGVVEEILNHPWTWQALGAILVLKVLATVATTGSGAVGGVFTPTLFCGAVIGALFGELLQALLPHAQISVGSFAIVGMGCFLAGTTRAPIMAIIMPLMLACVSAFYVSRSIAPESVYSRQLHHERGEPPLFLLHVRDLMKKNPLSLRETSNFEQIAAALASHTFKHLYVVDAEEKFLGAIALQDL